MPELPEVETVTRDIRKYLVGQCFKNIRILDDRVVKDLSSKAFIRTLKNKTIKSVTRRAKAIIITFDQGGFLVVQLKMTGHFIIGKSRLKEYSPRDVKVAFILSNDTELYYLDQRTFGWLIAIDQLNQVPYLNTVGPEPLSSQFNPKWFYGVIKKRTAPIKNLLLNQNVVAGLGNIYVSEVLYAAGVHPERNSNTLREGEVELICKHTQDILKTAIRLRGTSMRNYRDAQGKKGRFLNRIKVYGRNGQECDHCGNIIERIIQAGRSSFYCAKCQG